ncbi:hypothetical protein AB3480_36310 [Rhizobium mongolense]|uniref:hypothetical protein n=1 Tax=Rhizobium mongolense TaxID=57676 RepID=UPI0034A2EFBF
MCRRSLTAVPASYRCINPLITLQCCDRDGFRGEPDQCVKTVDVCNERRDQGYRRFSESGGDKRCIKEVATPRPRRENPWFFDIPNDKGVKERFWFNLDT